MLPTHNPSRLIIQESSSLSGKGEMHKNLHTVVGLFLWTILGDDIRIGHFFVILWALFWLLWMHTHFPFITLFKMECYGKKCFSTYQALCSWQKNTLSQVSVSVSPQGNLFHWKSTCTAKSYIIMLIHLPMLNISKPY